MKHRSPRIVWRGPRDGRSFALTFDDGPHPEITPRLLDVLAAHGARATFFLVGSRAVQWPGAAARIAEAGHAIGSHGYAHRGDWWRSRRTLEEDLAAAERVLGGILSEPKLFRPPFGALSLSWYRAARRRGYTVALWNVMCYDWWHTDVDRLFMRLASSVRPGALVLLHECRAQTGEGYWHTVEAVERFLECARLRGWRSVSVPEYVGRSL